MECFQKRSIFKAKPILCIIFIAWKQNESKKKSFFNTSKNVWFSNRREEDNANYSCTVVKDDTLFSLPWLATKGLAVLPWEMKLACAHPDEAPSELRFGGAESRQHVSQAG